MKSIDNTGELKTTDYNDVKTIKDEIQFTQNTINKAKIEEKNVKLSKLDQDILNNNLREYYNKEKIQDGRKHYWN